MNDDAHGAGYRLDIDGLRAIAVTSVVLYHAGVPGISGGFVGVDVFFVLSGYLITGQLWGAREQRFRSLIADFYARRARRILPSLGVVIICTLIAGRLLLLPDGEQQELALSGIASSLFLSNVYFWHQSGGYFAGPAELQPLLHTWSLAVEEQFYLVWPIFLPILWGLGKRIARARVELFTVGGILLASLVSLALSIVLTGRSPGAAFFMMPSRLWELGIGAALALALRQPRQWKIPSAFSLVGLAGILLAVLLYSKTTRFPGVAALLPVLGTALVVAAGAGSTEGIAYRLLASRPMTLIGSISYSWYLWHWPLLAITRALDLGARRLPRDLALVAVAFVLAWASTRYLENPIRRKKVPLFRSRAGALLVGAAILGSFSVISVFILNRANQYYRAELAPASLPCMQPHGIGLIIYPLAVVEDSTGGGSCTLARGAESSIFLVGDSHANHWSPAIAMLAQERGAHAVERSFGACPVLLAHQDAMADAAGVSNECRKFSKETMREVTTSTENKDAKLVVLSMFWSDWQAYWPGTTPSPDALSTSLHAAIRELDAAHVKVLLIGPTPRFDSAVPACVARRSADACRTPRANYDDKARTARTVLTSVAASDPNVKLWDPAERLCNAEFCYAEKDGFLVFRDEHHLSRRGAESAVPAIAEVVSSLLETSRSSR